MADELDDVPLSPTRPTAESTLVLDGTQKFRTRPLALVYSAKEDRKQFENRLNDWRLELSENINKPQKEWSQPWRPPYPPHHLLGDPQTQYDRANYIAAQAERATSLSEGTIKTDDDFDDTELVRRRVQDLTRLAEMRWRYRVVDKGAACRSEGLEP